MAIICNETTTRRDRRRREGRVYFFTPAALRPQYLQVYLSDREEMLYEDLADLWRPEFSITTTGAMDARTYRRVATGIPCYLDRHPSASQLERFGRTEQDDLFTRDIWNFAEEQLVKDTWVIVCKSIDPDGQRSVDYGKCWTCAGDRQPIERTSRRSAGCTIIVAVAQPELPNGVDLGP